MHQIVDCQPPGKKNPKKKKKQEEKKKTKKTKKKQKTTRLFEMAALSERMEVKSFVEHFQYNLNIVPRSCSEEVLLAAM